EVRICSSPLDRMILAYATGLPEEDSTTVPVRVVLFSCPHAIDEKPTTSHTMLPSINILFQVFTPHFARFGYVGWLTPDLYCFLTMGKSKESLTNFADWYRTNSEFIIT